MSPGPTARTAPCTRSDATARLQQARKFLEVAELAAMETDALAESGNVSASLAVLAGIAAADAACCRALGRRGRGQDHTQAVALIGEVSPGGAKVSKDLDRLLAAKDAAHYGVLHVSGTELKAVLRHSPGADLLLRRRTASVA